MAPEGVCSGMAEVFATGIQMGESPRWHDGRFWMCDWVAGEVLVFDANSYEKLKELPIKGMPWGVVTSPKAMGSLDQP